MSFECIHIKENCSSAFSLCNLSEKIQDKLNDGWKPMGGPVSIGGDLIVMMTRWVSPDPSTIIPAKD